MSSKVTNFSEQDKLSLPLTVEQNDGKKYGRSLAVFQNVFFQLQHEKPLKDDVVRLLILLSPKVRLMDETPSEQTIFSLHAKEYASLTKLEIKGAYTALDRAVSSLYDHSIVYTDPNRGLVRTRLVTSVAYKNGIFTVSFSHFALHIMRVFNQAYPFTKLQIFEFAKLSGYALKLYPIFIQNRFRKKISLSISDIKELLSIDPASYTDYKDFKKQVLKPHIEKINTSTELSVSFSAEKKEGRKASHVLFTITKKVDINPTEQLEEDDEREPTPKDTLDHRASRLASAIMAHGLADRFKRNDESVMDMMKRIKKEVTTEATADQLQAKLEEFGVVF